MTQIKENTFCDENSKRQSKIKRGETDLKSCKRFSDNIASNIKKNSLTQRMI